jgi:hypothetical protein
MLQHPIGPRTVDTAIRQRKGVRVAHPHLHTSQVCDAAAGFGRHPRIPVHPDDRPFDANRCGEVGEVRAGPASHVKNRLPEPQVQGRQQPTLVVATRGRRRRLVEVRDPINCVHRSTTHRESQPHQRARRVAILWSSVKHCAGPAAYLRRWAPIVTKCSQ